LTQTTLGSKIRTQRKENEVKVNEDFFDYVETEGSAFLEIPA